LFIDADSTIALAYGPAKQGVSFCYIKQRALHPLIATVLEPGSTQDVLHTRLREDKAGAARGAASFHRRVDQPSPDGRQHRRDLSPPGRRLLQRQGDRGLPAR